MQPQSHFSFSQNSYRSQRDYWPLKKKSSGRERPPHGNAAACPQAEEPSTLNGRRFQRFQARIQELLEHLRTEGHASQQGKSLKTIYLQLSQGRGYLLALLEEGGTFIMASRSVDPPRTGLFIYSTSTPPFTFVEAPNEGSTEKPQCNHTQITICGGKRQRH